METPIPAREPDLDTRVTRVESDLHNLAESVDDIRDTMDTRFTNLDRRLDQGLAEVFHKIDRVGEKNQITWPLIFTAVTTLVAIAGVGGVIHSMSLKPLAEATKANARTIERATENLDEVLQREMRLLDERQRERIDGVQSTDHQRFRALEREVFGDDDE